MIKIITIKTQFEAMHYWPDAPDEVSFLRDLHRHIFHVEANIQVSHDDRELEFFMVKKFLDKTIVKMLKDLQFSRSCEQMAEYLLRAIEKKYKVKGEKRMVSVSVSEDGENGASVMNWGHE